SDDWKNSRNLLPPPKNQIQTTAKAPSSPQKPVSASPRKRVSLFLPDRKDLTRMNRTWFALALFIAIIAEKISLSLLG
ncbi:MAG: hypothetical protein P8X86_18865, partial [Desulfofustis sp.]